jgi:hypothetical protein
MRILIVSESHIGSHYTAISKFEKAGAKVELLSLQGSRGVKFTNRGYSVSYAIKEYAKKFDIVLLGTDLDLQGTKIASALFYQLPVKSIRVAFTEKGYIRIGGVFPKSRLGKTLLLDRKHLSFASEMRKKFGVKSFGLSKAIAVRNVVLARESKSGVKVLSKGTSTITVLTKAELKGYGSGGGMARLESYYRSGVIEYPRVDNDYISNKPYDLYPHPPLPRLQDELFQPFEENELELNEKTILLELSNRRLITPANALKIHRTIKLFFSSSLKPKEEYKPIIKYLLERVDEEEEQAFKQLLNDIYFPQLYLSPELEIDRELLDYLFEFRYDTVPNSQADLDKSQNSRKKPLKFRKIVI